MIQYLFAGARKGLYPFDNILATKDSCFKKKKRETKIDFSISVLGKPAVKRYF